MPPTRQDVLNISKLDPKEMIHEAYFMYTLASNIEQGTQRLSILNDLEQSINLADKLPLMDKVNLAVFCQYRNFIQSISKELNQQPNFSPGNLNKILIKQFINKVPEEIIRDTLDIKIQDFEKLRQDAESQSLSNDEILKKLFLNWISAGMFRLICTNFFEDLAKSKNEEEFINLRKNFQHSITQPFYRELSDLNRKLDRIFRDLNKPSITRDEANKFAKAAKRNRPNNRERGFSLADSTNLDKASPLLLMSEIREDYEALLSKINPKKIDRHNIDLLNQYFLLEYSGIASKLKEYQDLLKPSEPSSDKVKSSNPNELFKKNKIEQSSLKDIVSDFKGKIKILSLSIKRILATLKPSILETNPKQTSDSGSDLAANIFLVQLLNPINKYFGKIKPLEGSDERSLDDFRNIFSDQANARIKEYLDSKFPGTKSKGFSPELDITKSYEYLIGYINLLEDVFSNSYVDDDYRQELLRNEDEARSLRKPCDSDLMQVGANDFFLRQNNYTVETLGNYAEKRFLLGLQDLAHHNKGEFIVIAPNEVGFINNRLGADALVIKREPGQAIKILALDCKAGKNAAKQEKPYPCIYAYALPENDLKPITGRRSLNRQFSLANQMKLDINNFFSKSNKENSGHQEELAQRLGELITRLGLMNEKIFSNPSENFYRMRDTREARELEKMIYEAFTHTPQTATP
ncbi:MAG: hypothetical protein VKK32_08580 [Candidatus Melainabacteria bacterium]|nr:hypothetical protein [Candidatus Melainabacteria bacterium]